MVKDGFQLPHCHYYVVLRVPFRKKGKQYEMDRHSKRYLPLGPAVGKSQHAGFSWGELPVESGYPLSRHVPRLSSTMECALSILI